MKHLFIILAISGILLQTFGNAIILVHYQLNKEFIAKNLCENRNKPMMHCNGKCHLRKQLAKESKKENNSPFQNLKEKYEFQYFSTTESISFYESDKKTESYFFYSRFFPNLSPNSIFHPPQA